MQPPPTPQDSAAVLSKVPLFADLSADEISGLARRTARHHVPAGQLIFAEDDPCEGLFVVESGAVKIFKTSPSGREQVLAIEGPFGIVAELPVFDGGPYPASASASHDSSLLFVSKSDFRALCLEKPEVALKVLRAVGKRLRRLVDLIEELSFTTVRHRLASHVLRLAKSEGQKTDNGVAFTLPVNQELASHIGTVRELVSRNLSRLQAGGIIRLDGKQLVVLDMAALEAETESET
jgi:cAMP-binding proteins - catabolite gene activator and regulatory subunit of cAMP-dependent protein kinases